MALIRAFAPSIVRHLPPTKRPIHMAMLPIIWAPDPRLKVTSEPVGEVDAAIVKLIDDMLATMYA